MQRQGSGRASPSSADGSRRLGAGLRLTGVQADGLCPSSRVVAFLPTSPHSELGRGGPLPVPFPGCVPGGREAVPWSRSAPARGGCCKLWPHLGQCGERGDRVSRRTVRGTHSLFTILDRAVACHGGQG